MSLNPTKKTIGWCDFSWNPITGCDHGCWYCYADRLFRRFGKSFDPAFHPERLGQPAKRKKPAKIFVCSVSDLFAPWTKDGWREAVLNDIKECPVKHTFQLLTKNPERIDKNYQFPDNVWVGTTVTGIGDLQNIEEIKKVKAKVKFVSFEPLLAEIKGNLRGIDWVIIGKLTGSKKVKFNPAWVVCAKALARAWNIPVFLKGNLELSEKIQEFPKSLKGLSEEEREIVHLADR